jgi:hypothetical protein
VYGVQLKLVLDWHEVSVLTGLSISDEGHLACGGLVDLRRCRVHPQAILDGIQDPVRVDELWREGDIDLQKVGRLVTLSGLSDLGIRRKVRA